MGKIPSDAKKVFEGVIFDVYQWEEKRFDGSIGIVETLKRKDGAAVIALDEQKNVVLQRERQFFWNEEKIGVPAGGVDKNETAQEAIERELLEETGYRATHWKLWFTHEPDAKVDWRASVFIAAGAKKVQEPQPDPGEKIESFVVPIETFIEEASKETFRNKNITNAVLRFRAEHRLDEFYKLLQG